MISEETFVAIKSWDRTLDRVVNEADAIIDHKNVQLKKLVALLEATQKELASERGRRKMAELKLMRRNH